MSNAMWESKSNYAGDKFGPRTLEEAFGAGAQLDDEQAPRSFGLAWLFVGSGAFIALCAVTMAWFAGA